MPAFSRSAAFYDLIYKDRDYSRDIDHVLAVGNEPWMSGGFVLDYGAGTGEHIRQWVVRGWKAIGLDPSPEMVELAADKYLDVRLGSFETKLDFKAHAAIQTCFFAAFSYAAASPGIDIQRMLGYVFRNAARGGLFAFDAVNYSAAACHLIESEIGEFRGDGRVVTRKMLKWFDLQKSLLHNEITYLPNVGSPGHFDDAPGFTETHILRAFTPNEITDHLASAGFDVLAIFDPESAERAPVRPDSFYFMVIAKVRK